MKGKRATGRQLSTLTPLELERLQLSLVKGVKMCEHEQVKEYCLFLGEFHRYLQGLKKWSDVTDEWLVILAEYSQLFGLPKDAYSHIQMARILRSKERGDQVVCYHKPAILAMMKGCMKALQYFTEHMKVLRGQT